MRLRTASACGESHSRCYGIYATLSVSHAPQRVSWTRRRQAPTSNHSRWNPGARGHPCSIGRRTATTSGIAWPKSLKRKSVTASGSAYSFRATPWWERLPIVSWSAASRLRRSSLGRQKTPISRPDAEAMTIYGAKGLTFDTVLLPCVEESEYTHHATLPTSLLFVATTRALSGLLQHEPWVRGQGFTRLKPRIASGTSPNNLSRT